MTVRRCKNLQILRDIYATENGFFIQFIWFCIGEDFLSVLLNSWFQDSGKTGIIYEKHAKHRKFYIVHRKSLLLYKIGPQGYQRTVRICLLKMQMNLKNIVVWYVCVVERKTIGMLSVWMKLFLALGVFLFVRETISKLPEWEEINSHMFNTILHLQNVFSRIWFFN